MLKQLTATSAIVFMWNSGGSPALGNVHRTCPENSRHVTLRLTLFICLFIDGRIWYCFTKVAPAQSPEIEMARPPKVIEFTRGPPYS